MARIRSVHPEQWNDEDFCTLSLPARLLALGMRNFADDNGAFEWKPLRMKMRVFPADSIDVEPLLNELEQTGLVRRYVTGGTTYGLIRNFRRFQRPKSPTGSYPKPSEWDANSEIAGYVGASFSEGVPEWYGKGSERVPKQSGNSSAEGVGVGEEKKKEQSARGASRPAKPASPSVGRRRSKITITEWLAELDVLQEDAVPGGDPIFAYTEKAAIPDEFLTLAWEVFRDAAIASKKTQKDWRHTFRNYVQNGYLKLWYFDGDGECRLTTVGIQAQRQHKDAA